jgi:hypothetical protein
MAIKYTREGATRHDHGEHGRFGRPLRKSPGELQSRLRIIYYGIFAFTVVMFVAYAMDFLKPAQWGETQTGLGVIAEKSTLIAEDESTVYAISIALPDAAAELSETVSVDEQTWLTLAVGDEVSIEYRISLDNERLRIEQLDPPQID